MDRARGTGYDPRGVEPVLFFLVFGAIVAAIVAIAIAAHILERRRREALAAVAASLGFSFSPGDPIGMPSRFGFLDALAQGANRYAYNVMQGALRDQQVIVFDYHYETYSHNSKGGRQTHHHYFSGAVLMLPANFPELRVRPEGFLDKLGALVGFDDIDFESIEFSRAYCVKARDRKFAYDVFHPRMMELFLQQRGLVMEIEHDSLMLMRSGRLDPAIVRGWVEVLVAIRERMPEYLFRA